MDNASPSLHRPSTSTSHVPHGLKKLMSQRSRTSLNAPSSENVSIPDRRSGDSIRDGLGSENSRRSSRDDSGRPGSGGIRKLIPGLSKRKHKHKRLNEQAPSSPVLPSESDSSTALGADSPNLLLVPPSKSAANGPSTTSNKSATSLLLDDNSSLLTDDSEPSSAHPPLTTHDSHAGYLTHTSPLITTTTVGDDLPATQPEQTSPATGNSISSAGISRSFPSLSHSPTLPAELPSAGSSPNLLSPVIADRSSTFNDASSSRRKSISNSFRSISPARKLREAFQPGRSPKLGHRISPERESSSTKGWEEQDFGGTLAGRGRAPPPIAVDLTPEVAAPISGDVLPRLDLNDRPQTPKSATSFAPSTTVTPPTPVNARAPSSRSPTRSSEVPLLTYEPAYTSANPSASVLGHRRLHSDTSALHAPSKLSNSVLAPLTPTIEEVKTPSVKADSRNVTPGSGFFSSWVSVAQNAASTITNTLNTPKGAKTNTDSTELPGTVSESQVEPDLPTTEAAVGKRKLAVDTLGAGDLKLSHLGFESDTNADAMDNRKNTAIKRDEAAAKIEDVLAKRAVSAAYEKPADLNARTPTAESSDPIHILRQGTTFQSNGSSELQITPNGSIADGDSGSVKRANSVRSRLKERRKRGSSTATGGSAVGALLAASASSLTNPAAGPKSAGFVLAPKARNRTFHQLFRSVPEDDFLIEDYSCALQKEILLAGRIYISEGHICFSSNILGWVTTLVISFEEIVAVEKESTAMVFPNAIAIQTLHARHTFRSLLSRESTYDLMIGIWKASHPAAFKKSMAGSQAAEEAAPAVGKAADSESDSDDGSEDEDEVYDEDEEQEGDGSVGDGRSLAGSELPDTAPSTHKGGPAINGASMPMVGYPPSAVDAQATEKAVAAASAATVDFPGPTTHAPTECADAATHYDKVIKDETIPAPLGKIYSMLFGPTSGVFLRKYLVDEQKVLELQYEDDKKGLGDQNKSRSMSYIKPLSGSIGPKQTKCLITENLDAFDLEKAVSVTCTTQTPDVPSGNVFSVKTRYCLSWAGGNSTRFQMNCTVEWTGKSWLKGPIEKGATDGQQTYGTDLVKALKASVSSRPRAATNGSKFKGGKRKRKGDKSSSEQPKSKESPDKVENWGLFEPVRSILGPIVDIIQPVSQPLTIIVIIILVGIIWFRRPSGSPRGRGVGYSESARIAAYEEMWRGEENDLWQWLEERVGIDGVALNLSPDDKDAAESRRRAKSRAIERQKLLSSRNVQARLGEEHMSEREMEEAIRTTQEKLEILKGVMQKKKSKGGAGSETNEKKG